MFNLNENSFHAPNPNHSVNPIGILSQCCVRVIIRENKKPNIHSHLNRVYRNCTHDMTNTSYLKYEQWIRMTKLISVAQDYSVKYDQRT